MRAEIEQRMCYCAQMFATCSQPTDTSNTPCELDNPWFLVRQSSVVNADSSGTPAWQPSESTISGTSPQARNRAASRGQLFRPLAVLPVKLHEYDDGKQGKAATALR